VPWAQKCKRKKRHLGGLPVLGPAYGTPAGGNSRFQVTWDEDFHGGEKVDFLRAPANKFLLGIWLAGGAKKKAEIGGARGGGAGQGWRGQEVSARRGGGR